MEAWSSCRRLARSTIGSCRPRLTRVFLLTEGTREEGYACKACKEIKRRVENVRSSPAKNGKKVASLTLGEHLINLIKAVTEREIHESIQRKGPELDAGEASDKHRRSCERGRIYENWHKFPSDIMAWYGGG
jgi:hypothetical protein